jgi:uncharacterized protein (DUF983 family)
MSTCPHCRQRVSLFRCYLYTKRRPYRCSRCRKQSHFDGSARLLLAAGLVAFSSAFAHLIFHAHGFLAALAAVGGVLVALTVILWSTLPLQPLREGPAGRAGARGSSRGGA